MHTKAQEKRKKALHRLGHNLQDRLSTKYMDVLRLDPGQGFSHILINVKVNATIARDAPDSQTVPTAPIRETIRVHMEKSLASMIKNSDTIIIKVLSEDGTSWSDVWRGIAGNPATLDSRTRLNVKVEALGSGSLGDIAPPPEAKALSMLPHETSAITISFITKDGEDIRPADEHLKKIGSNYELTALEINGFEFLYFIVDNVLYDRNSFVFTALSPIHEIYFVYKQLNVPTYLRNLVNGRFKRTDGSLVNMGYHWYRKIELEYRSTHNGIMIIAITSPPLGTASAQYAHSETRGIVRLQAGSRVRLFPQDMIMEILSVVREGNQWIFEMEEREINQQEISGEVTFYYDVP